MNSLDPGQCQRESTVENKANLLGLGGVDQEVQSEGIKRLEFKQRKGGSQPIMQGFGKAFVAAAEAEEGKTQQIERAERNIYDSRKGKKKK